MTSHPPPLSQAKKKKKKFWGAHSSGDHVPKGSLLGTFLFSTCLVSTGSHNTDNNQTHNCSLDISSAHQSHVSSCLTGISISKPNAKPPFSWVTFLSSQLPTRVASEVSGFFLQPEHNQHGFRFPPTIPRSDPQQRVLGGVWQFLPNWFSCIQPLAT